MNLSRQEASIKHQYHFILGGDFWTEKYGRLIKTQKFRHLRQLFILRVHILNPKL